MLTQSWDFAVVNKVPKFGRINKDVRHRRKMAQVGTPILRKNDGLVLRADKKGKMRLIEVND